MRRKETGKVRRNLDDSLPTKESIFFAAVRLFATEGYATVSMRDIAEAADITASAIYNHFPSKEAILTAIIEKTGDIIQDYYERMAVLVRRAGSFEEVMGYLFKELEDVQDMTVYYGVAILASEEFHSRRASIALNRIFMERGVDFMSEVFARCIDEGWVKPFDVVACATFVMNNVYAGSLAYVQRDLGRKVLYDPSEMFAALREYIIGTLKV